MKRIFLLTGLPALGGGLLAVATAAVFVPGSQLPPEPVLAGWVLWASATSLVWYLGLYRPLRALATKTIPPVTQALDHFADILALMAQGTFSDQAWETHVGRTPVPRALGPARDLGTAFTRLEGTLDAMGSSLRKINGEPCRRLFFVGPDAMDQGRDAARVLGKALGGQGQVLVLMTALGSTGQDARRRGFQTILEADFPGIKVVQLVETGDAPETVRALTLRALADHPELSAVYVTEGGTPPLVAAALEEAGKSASVSLVVHDFAEETLRLVDSGQILASIGESTYALGHDPVIHLYNHLAAGWVPETSRLILSPLVVRKDNLGQFWRPGRGFVLSAEALAALPCPLTDQPAKPLKIAVLGCENSPYWLEIRTGVQGAAGRLADKAVRVDWVSVPGDLTTENCTPFLQGFLDQRFDGVAAVIADQSLVPLVNRLTAQGLVVAAYQAEPMGLRSFLGQAGTQAAQLMETEHKLLDGLVTVGQLGRRQEAALAGLRGHHTAQSGRSRTIRDQSRALGLDLQKVFQEVRLTVEATHRATDQLQRGSRPLADSLDTVQFLEESFLGTDVIYNSLEKQTAQIFGIVGQIETIVSRVNLLAFNASIEASRAGNAGRGFKVIAEEVRSLSSATEEAIRQISSRANGLKADLAEVKSLMDQSLRKVRVSIGRTEASRNIVRDLGTFLVEESVRAQGILERLDPAFDKIVQAGQSLEALEGHDKEVLTDLEDLAGLHAALSESLKATGKAIHTLGSLAQSQNTALGKFRA